MKMYKAFAANNRSAAAQNSPRAAAEAFFAAHPAARKCNITEGECDGAFFTIRYGRASQGEWPYSVKDVTKKTVGELPA